MKTVAFFLIFSVAIASFAETQSQMPAPPHATPCLDILAIAAELEQRSPSFSNLTRPEIASHQNIFTATAKNIDALRKYDGAELRALQDASLKKSLQARGSRVAMASGYDTLKIESANNRKRWSEAVTSGDDIPEARKLLSHLDFIFQHNTMRYTHRGHSPIFSSRQLELLGMTGGLNTLKFNRDILQTDDNVYFFVLPILKGVTKISADDLPDSKGAYGRNYFQLDSTYAETAAWVSPFIMFPDEFINTVSAIDPMIGRSLAHSSTQSKNYLGLARKGVETLHRADFTVDDFRGLIQDRLYDTLRELHRDEPRMYETTLANLKSGDYAALKSTLQLFVFYPMGLRDDRFECKVPVAVPARETASLTVENKKSGP
jgi:hypothetical protein